MTFGGERRRRCTTTRTVSPDMSLNGPARRDILKRELYNYRGVQMVDLIHASRGCRFKLFPLLHPVSGGDPVQAAPH